MRLARLFVPLAILGGCSASCAAPTEPKSAEPTPPQTTAPPTARAEATSPGPVSTGSKEEEVSPEADESAECQGRASEELLSALRSRGAASRQCFQALLERGTETRGQIKVTLRIAADGEVLSLALRGDDVDDMLFNECLAEHFKVPYGDSPPEGGCVTVKVPLNFSVKKSKPAQASDPP